MSGQRIMPVKERLSPSDCLSIITDNGTAVAEAAVAGHVELAAHNLRGQCQIFWKSVGSERMSP